MNRRGLLIFFLTALAVLSWQKLNLSWTGLIPHQGGAELAKSFFKAAWEPAWNYQAEHVPPGSPPFFVLLAQGIGRTLFFALAAMSLALLVGIPLGCLGSQSSPPWIRGPIRIFMAAMRSVHELLWAVLFLAAFGLNTFAAVIAITIPYAGTLGKIYAEILEETPKNAHVALRSLGASPLLAFFGGLLPRAAPDLSAYAFYRLECAIRSSAILGFFGYETMGYYLKASFDNLHFREVWTWLYLLIAIVLLMEAWSGQLRRRFVA